MQTDNASYYVCITEMLHAKPAWGHHAITQYCEKKPVGQATNNTTLLTKEALYIRFSHSQLMNRDKSVTIPEYWQPFLNHADQATPESWWQIITIDTMLRLCNSW